MYTMMHVILASILGYLGLHMDSTYAVIGAMVVSPYGSLLMDEKYVKLILSIFMTFGIAFVLETLFPILDSEVTSKEIKNRANFSRYDKNAWLDFMYAVVAGYVLAYTRREDIGIVTALGIGTSLLPPVVNSGILAANGDLEGGLNSAYITVRNLVGIFIGFHIIPKWVGPKL